MPAADDLMALATELVHATVRAGADDAEVLLHAGHTSRLTLQDGDLCHSEGHRAELALRVWRAKRRSLLTSQDLRPRALAALARRAVAEADGRGVEAPAHLAPPPGPGALAGPEHAPVPAAEQAALLRRLDGSVRRLPRPLSSSAALSGARLWKVLVSSTGFRAAYRATSFRVWFWVEGPHGHVTVGAAGQRFDDLAADALAARLDEQAGSLAAGPAPEPAPAGPCQVYLPPPAAADLARCFGQLFCAEHLLGDLRPLLDRFGRPVASPAVTLVDDATLEGRAGSRPLDDEGTPTQATALIERGRLVGALHTLQTAAALGAAPNGKALRTAMWEQPRAAPSTVYLAAGEAAPGELRGALRRGVVVSGLLRPGRLQGATGKFVAVARGWWVEPGRPRRPVSGVRLSASPFELLRVVRACGQDLELSALADGAGAPSVLLDRMEVG